MELLVSVEDDDVINYGENQSGSKRGCWDTEGKKSVFPIENWYGSYNITHCRAHVIPLSGLRCHFLQYRFKFCKSYFVGQ
jgi:hypothetical protein